MSNVLVMNIYGASIDCSYASAFRNKDNFRYGEKARGFFEQSLCFNPEGKPHDELRPKYFALQCYLDTSGTLLRMSLMESFLEDGAVDQRMFNLKHLPEDDWLEYMELARKMHSASLIDDFRKRELHSRLVAAASEELKKLGFDILERDEVEAVHRADIERQNMPPEFVPRLNYVLTESGLDDLVSFMAEYAYLYPETQDFKPGRFDLNETTFDPDAFSAGNRDYLSRDP